MFLNGKDTFIMRRLTNIFKKNSETVFKGKKRKKVLSEPTRLPIISLKKRIFFFNKRETAKSKRKSKKKFKKSTKSRYIFMLSPKSSI